MVTFILGNIMIIISIMLSIAVFLILTDIPSVVIFIFPKYTYFQDGYFLYYYPHIIQYITIYVIGFYIGQFLYEERKFNFTLTKNIMVTSIGMGSFLYHIIHGYEKVQTNEWVEYNMPLKRIIGIQIANTFYNIFLGYFILYLIQNPTNFISRVLSHKLIAPFSRLSYCVYLIHVPVIFHMFLQTRSPISYDNTNLIVSSICLRF